MSKKTLTGEKNEMWELLRTNLKIAWLAVALTTLLTPLVLTDSRSTATITMFILSFPSSMIAMPMIYMTNAVLGIGMTSIGALFVTQTLLFIAGFVQWLWIVPRILVGQPELAPLDLHGMEANRRLFERHADGFGGWFNAKGETPLERALNDD